MAPLCPCLIKHHVLLCQLGVPSGSGAWDGGSGSQLRQGTIYGGVAWLRDEHGVVRPWDQQGALGGVGPGLWNTS